MLNKNSILDDIEKYKHTKHNIPTQIRKRFLPIIHACTPVYEHGASKVINAMKFVLQWKFVAAVKLNKTVNNRLPAFFLEFSRSMEQYVKEAIKTVGSDDIRRFSVVLTLGQK